MILSRYCKSQNKIMISSSYIKKLSMGSQCVSISYCYKVTFFHLYHKTILLFAWHSKIPFRCQSYNCIIFAFGNLWWNCNCCIRYILLENILKLLIALSMFPIKYLSIYNIEINTWNRKVAYFLAKLHFASH